MRKKLLLVIVAALLSAQAQDGGWYSGEHNQWGSGQHGGWNSGGPTEDYGVVGGAVVESGQHNQWGSLRYRVVPGQYTVIGELIQGGDVVGIPRVDNPNPLVDAEQVRRSTVRYTPSRREAPPSSSPGGGSSYPLILRDAQGNPLAYFNDEWEARQYLSGSYVDELRRQGRLTGGDPRNLPHYSSCNSGECRAVASAAERFKQEERRRAEAALQGFLQAVREVAQAIADLVRSVVQPVVDLFARVFDWVQNAVNNVVASAGNGSGSGSGSGNGSSGSPGSGNGSSGSPGSGNGSSGSPGSGNGSGGQNPPPPRPPIWWEE